MAVGVVVGLVLVVLFALLSAAEVAVTLLPPGRIHRLEEARIATKVKAGASDQTRIPADSFQVACQQACPAEAIVFGDIKNPASRVAQMRQQDARYNLLEYLNLNVRVSYLARLRNPNPKMPGAEKVGRGEEGTGHPVHQEGGHA